jgi:hypothetical protein
LLSQSFGEAAINTTVLLLVGDGEGKDFLFAEVAEALQGRLIF